MVDVDGSGAKHAIRAHSNALSFIVFNHNNTLLATASTKGTCIRIYRAADGELVKEMRRGVEASDIQWYGLVLASLLS